MKDKLKNTLEHEVELLGRSISVLAIAGLLVVGGASAALLNSFGSIDGEADVTQSVYVGNSALSDSDTEPIFDATSDGDGSIVAGESVTGTTTVENRGDLPVPVDFTSSGDYTEDGVDYEYALLKSVSGSSNKEIDNEETENSASAEVIRNDGSFAVRATADIDEVEQDGGDTEAYAGVFFDVSNQDYTATDLEETSATVDYTVPEVEGETNVADDQAPDWFWVTFEDKGEELTAIASAWDSVNPDTVKLSDYPHGDVPVYDSEGNSEGVASGYNDVEVTGIGFTTGSARSADPGDYFEVIYDEVDFDGTDLISERTYTPTSEDQAETIDLQPDTEYDFTGFMDTSVYTQPTTGEGYSVSTELDVGDQN